MEHERKAWFGHEQATSDTVDAFTVDYYGRSHYNKREWRAIVRNTAGDELHFCDSIE